MSGWRAAGARRRRGQIEKSNTIFIAPSTQAARRSLQAGKAARRASRQVSSERERERRAETARALPIGGRSSPLSLGNGRAGASARARPVGRKLRLSNSSFILYLARRALATKQNETTRRVSGPAGRASERASGLAEGASAQVEASKWCEPEWSRDARRAAPGRAPFDLIGGA